jgi:hypothetical protein
VGGRRVTREGDGRKISKYFIYLFENRTMKCVEIVLRRVEGGIGRRMEGVIKVHCKHIWKCHNETTLYN